MSHLRTSWGLCVCTLILLLTLTGCGGGGEVVDPPLPSLTELSSVHQASHAAVATDSPDGPISQSTADATPDSRTMGVVAISSIVRIWLPGYQSLDAFWAQASTATLSESDLNHWRDNQLRAAVVNKVDLPALLQKLPGHLGIRQQMLTLTDDLTPLEPASLSEAHQPVTVVMDQQRKTLGRGKAQLLIVADPQGGDWVKVTILPHIYRPRVSILPRPHTEAALDGLILSDLMLRALLRPGQVLIIGPALSIPEPDDTPAPAATAPPVEHASAPAEGLSAEDDETGGSDPLKPESTVLEVPPVTQAEPAFMQGVGRAVLTGRRVNTPLQQIILLEIKKAP